MYYSRLRVLEYICKEIWDLNVFIMNVWVLYNDKAAKRQRNIMMFSGTAHSYEI